MAYGNESILDMMEKNFLKATKGVESSESSSVPKNNEPRQKECNCEKCVNERNNIDKLHNEKHEKHKTDDSSFEKKLTDELNFLSKEKPRKSGFDLSTVMSLMNNPIVQSLLANNNKKEEPVKKPTLPDFIKKM